MENTASSTLRRRLRHAYIGIAVSLLLMAAVALVATTHLSGLLQTAISQTLPEMRNALRISEQGGLLAASLPVLVASEDRATLERHWSEIEINVQRIRRDLEQWGQGRAARASRQAIETEVHGYTRILDELRHATAERLDLRAALEDELTQVRAIHADLTDAIAPVVYGVTSLSRLLARREARRLAETIEARFEQSLARRLALSELCDALEPEAPGEDLRQALRQLAPAFHGPDEPSFYASLRAALDRLPASLEPAPAQRRELLAVCQDAIAANVAHWRERLQSGLEELRTAIPAQFDRNVADLILALDLKTEGHLLIALLFTVDEVDQAATLANLQDRAKRALASFQQAADGFADSTLAQRNPILANTVARVEARLGQTLDGRQGLFPLRRRQLDLIARGELELARARVLAAQLTQRIGEIVERMEQTTEAARQEALVGRRMTLSLLIATCVVGLGLALLIARVTRRALTRDEIALIRARDDIEQANRILEAVGFAARHLLGAARWEDTVEAVLQRLGTATACARVELLQCRDEDDDPNVLEARFCWCRSPDQQGSRSAFGGTAALLECERWMHRMMVGQPVFGTLDDLPAEERAFLAAHGIRSLLLVPIFVDRHWWGAIGFADCERLRDWPARLIDAVTAAADTLGAAIARAQIERQILQAAAVFEDTKEGVIIADARIRVLAVNRAFSTMTGYSAEETLGRPPDLLVVERHPPSFFRALWKRLTVTGQWQGEILSRRKDGSALPGWLSISRIRHGPGDAVQYVAILSDISAIKQSEQQLEFLAHHDVLTGLPNRLLLNDRLGRAIARAHRHQTRIAVLFLDLDRFKNINDSLGHPVGDLLLREVASRLAGRVRETDTVARLGGDEFIILIEDMTHEDEADAIARQLLHVLQAPYLLAERRLFVSASIGVSLYPGHGDDGEHLIRNADAAMYEAKAAGKNTYRLYTASLTEAALERLSLEQELRGALEREELELHYQPQCDARTGRIVVFEALLRWRRPASGGFIPPDRFLPLAEEAGLMIVIGDWVLARACRECRDWRNAGFPEMRVAVNLAGVQLEQGDILAATRSALANAGLPGEALELEVTESSAMQRLDEVRQTLFALRALGVTLAIDDFGTGYSSLSYLKRLPFTTLKIDRSFIGEIPEDANDMAIAHAIVVLAHTLQMSVIAEGVETPAQLAFLRGVDCELIQGYLFSRALPPEEILPLLRRDQGRILIADACES
ncbi:hypothetical protein CCR95_13195 [Thiocystis minor]|uniref:EAL domain-containing protein n=1 Tax=Thiocystis minor TaxID=61597 RepID=UPI001912BD7C|nr:EAL domain-containing protein [Thiocystis minor]MBK5965013.1 hypothetical protein [Thiocystis minor]